MALTVPVLRVLEACRGQRTHGPLVLRPVSGNPIDRRDAYRMVVGIAKAAGIPSTSREMSPAGSMAHLQVGTANRVPSVATNMRTGHIRWTPT
ncbi:hypothetical protein GCM10009844_01930 [Nocardioides koreensis]|uniref:Uncharacterized protein n=1 Tax=Nocardioides koreensis TaxID=433651 RepID=A0ABN2Z399_9ACTN